MLIREYAEGRERKTPSLEGHPIKMHDTSELGIHKWDVNKYRNLLHEILKSAQTMKGMKGFGDGKVCPGGVNFQRRRGAMWSAVSEPLLNSGTRAILLKHQSRPAAQRERINIALDHRFSP